MTKSKNIPFVEQVLQKIKSAYNIKTDASLARFLDMQPNTLAMQKKRGSLNWVKIFQKCKDIDKNWLLHDAKDPYRPRSSPIRIPLVNPDHLVSRSCQSLSERNGDNILIPSHLFPESLVTNNDLETCILVKVDNSSRLSDAKTGDILLIQTNEQKLQEGDYYILSINGDLHCSRLEIESNQQLILKNQDRDSPNDPEVIDSEEVNLIGRILWVGSHTKL